MFCPQCGSTQPDELNFCKACGSNLQAVRTALVGGTAQEKFDWNKTWLAEMMMSSEEKTLRAAKLARLPNAELKRQNEIKAGVITASTGAGLTIALYLIMQGIVASGAVSDAAIAILTRVWAVGLIPIFVGLALIVTGTLISRKPAELQGELTDDDNASGLFQPAETNQLGSGVPFSVTDETTRHLAPIPRGKTTTEIPDEKH